METLYPKPITRTETRIGWIGIGVMGSSMASRLLAGGYSVTIYARTPSKAHHLQTLGANLADSPRDLAQTCDIIFTMLGHPSDVRQIYLLENGLLDGLNPGGVVVDCTSSDPNLAKQIFDIAREKSCWSVDAPVSGGDIGARDGKLAVLAGGDSGVYEWLLPLFNILGKATYIGKAGSGQSCKIANQITVGGNLIGLSEGLLFARKAGLDLKQWVDSVKSGAAGSMVMELFGERMIDRDFKAGAFAEYMVKDLGMGVGGEGGIEAVLPGAALCKELFGGMIANGDGKLGIQGVIVVIERMNGETGDRSMMEQ